MRLLERIRRRQRDLPGNHGRRHAPDVLPILHSRRRPLHVRLVHHNVHRRRTVASRRARQNNEHGRAQRQQDRLQLRRGMARRMALADGRRGRGLAAQAEASDARSLRASQARIRSAAGKAILGGRLHRQLRLHFLRLRPRRDRHNDLASHERTGTDRVAAQGHLRNMHHLDRRAVRATRRLRLPAAIQAQPSTSTVPSSTGGRSDSRGVRVKQLFLRPRRRHMRLAEGSTPRDHRAAHEARLRRRHRRPHRTSTRALRKRHRAAGKPQLRVV